MKKSSSSSRGKPSNKGRKLLRRLLSERNQFPDRVSEIDLGITDKFESVVAILALDMVGFSRLTVKHGIIHYLAMIHQMEEAARPAVRDNGGKVIKVDADNLFAIFDAPKQALDGGLDILRAFEAINSVVPPDRDIYGSIGIGYGKTLVVADEDIFGCEVNIACKLGEDLATRGEILLTPAAYEALPRDRYVCSPVKFSLGELEIDSYRYDHSLFR